MTTSLCPPALSLPRLRELLHSVMLSPTSFNLQHWRFIVLDSDDVLPRGLMDSTAQAIALGDEPATWLVVASWAGAWAYAGHYARHLPDEVRVLAERNANAVYAGWERVQRDEAFRSSGLALATLARVCAKEGLDCQVLPLADASVAASALEVPDDFVVTAVALLRPLSDKVRQLTAPCRPVVHVDHYHEEARR